MTGVVTAFKALSLDAQTEAYPQITAAFSVVHCMRWSPLQRYQSRSISVAVDVFVRVIVRRP